MAIRIGPPPVLARLRLHWHATYNYYLRQSRAVEEASTRNQDRVNRWRRSANRYVDSVLHRRTRQVAHRKAQYIAFLERYEDLVEVLCWAAKDGDHTDRDVQYARIREWMQLNYHKVRPELRQHLGAWDGVFDPFEELFAPEWIDDVINDSGTIANFVCTRLALDAYRDALESAATKQ